MFNFRCLERNIIFCAYVELNSKFSVSNAKSSFFFLLHKESHVSVSIWIDIIKSKSQVTCIKINTS
jgi:hypothetical protein